MGSWNMTSEIPRDRIQAALVIKNTSSRPMQEMETQEIDETSFPDTIANGQYLKTLMEMSPRTITIAFEESFEGTTQISFPFIKKERERTVAGVTIHDDMEWIED